MKDIIRLRPGRVRGFSRQRGLVMPVDEEPLRDALAPDIVIDGLKLTRKHEFHVTLLDRKEAALVAEFIDDDALRARLLREDWTARASGSPWLIRDTRRDGSWRHSIVQLLELPALAAFRRGLAEPGALDLPEMPPHITLYVAGDPKGIGLGSQTRFETLRMRILPSGPWIA